MARAVQVSQAAARIFKMLKERPDDYSIERVAYDAGTSKSGVERALLELEENRLITIREEEL